MVLGIQPRWPETGYGYIEFAKGVKPSATPVDVLSFREKPDAETARRFVDGGNFYWNAGMFFWSAAVLLEALRKFLPKTATLLAGLPAFGARGFSARLAEAFPQVRKHFDRLRGAGTGVERGGNRGWGYRLERRGELERGL